MGQTGQIPFEEELKEGELDLLSDDPGDSGIARPQLTPRQRHYLVCDALVGTVANLITGDEHIWLGFPMNQPLPPSGTPPISWGRVRGPPIGPLADLLLSVGAIDDAVRSGDFGPLVPLLAKVLPDAMDYPDLLEHEFANTYILWQTRDPYVRRAWLNLGILRRSRQRPGGYTSDDLGRLAGARTRAPRRRIVVELLRLGVVRATRRRGKQPRYRYTGSVKLRFLSGIEEE